MEFSARKITILFAGIISFFFTAYVFAEDINEITAGVCNFEYKDNPESSISYSLSVSFYEELKNIKIHTLSGAEMTALLTKEKTENFLKLEIELEKLYSEKDEIIFQADNDLKEKKRSEIEQKIDEKLRQLEELENEINKIKENISPDDSVLLPFSLKTPDKGLIFERKPGSINESSVSYGLNYIIYGRIIDIEEYQVVEVRLWNNLIQTDTVVWRTALDSSSTAELLKPGINKIKTEVFGTDWSEISIDGPDNSIIYLDDIFIGIDNIRKLIVKPGIHEIRIKRTGAEDLVKEVVIGNEEHFELKIEIDNVIKREVIVQTFPAGADVYIDSEWMGLSPVKLHIEKEPAALMIKKNGYDDIVVFIDDDTGAILNIDLKPDVFQKDEYIPGTKKRFYNSFGGFLISIPFTALFYSLVEHTGEAYYREYNSNGTENLDELIRLQKLNELQYNLYIASLGMNIFLFSDTIIHGIDYVRSVDYFSR